jgi:hypothetical protein
MIFDELKDLPDVYPFYGVFNNCFKLGSLVFEALEDPDDGYRSYLKSIKVVKSDAIFSKRPLAFVQIRSLENSYSDGYTLYSPDTDHTWLKVTTDNIDDYYPYFVFEYTPDTNQTTYPESSDCPTTLRPEFFI